QRRKKRRYHLNPRCVHREQRLQLVEALLGCIVRLETRRSLQLSDDRTKRAVGMVGRALITQPRIPLAADAFGERLRKARLADSRLSRDQHDLPFTLPGETLAFQ